MRSIQQIYYDVKGDVNYDNTFHVTAEILEAFLNEVNTSLADTGAPFDIVNIGSGSPDAAQPNTIQTKSDGSVYFVDKDGDIQQIEFPAVTDRQTVVAAISDLASVNPTNIDTVTVKNVGVYSHSSSVLTDDGYSIVVGSSGYWVLDNSTVRLPVKNKEFPILAQLSSGGVTDAIENVTKNGAITTATIAKVGNYDNFIVTGGDSTSWIRFNKLSVTDNRYILKARIKVDSIGVTAPILGIGFNGVQETHDLGALYGSSMLVNLLTKVITRQGETAGVPTTTTSSAGTLCSNGDILELTIKAEPELSRMRFTVLNTYTGEFTNGIHNLISGGSGGSSRAAGVIMKLLSLWMTDGTYTVIDYKCISSVPFEPLVALVGDSFGCGYSLPTAQNIMPLLVNALPYDIVDYGGNGAYVISMMKYQMAQVLKTKPKYVFVFSILTLYLGYFDDGDANQTEFDTYMGNIMKAITSYGGIPVLIKWQTTGTYINGNSAAWDTKRAALVASYPTTLTLDLSAQALTFTGSGSHPSAADNIKIKREIISLLKTAGAI